MSRQGPEPMDVDDPRDIILYGDYDGAVEGLGVDLPDPNGGALVDVPVKLLAVSGGEAAKGVPEVRVWAIGDESTTKYWERKDTEEQKSKAAAGEWLPQIVANELFERMANEGGETVPIHEFIEEACNDTGDSVLAVEANLFHNEQAALRKALRAKRGLAQASIRRFFRERVRPRSTKKIATTFTQDCITFDEALNISFDELSSKVREDKVVSAARDMLHRVIQLANWGRATRPLISGTVNVKIYMAAYMIAARPTHVFESKGELEMRVLKASRSMLGPLHKAATALSQGRTWKHVRTHVAPRLPSLLCTYLRTFKDWKLVDEKKLANRLTTALCHLEEAERGLKGEEADAKIRAELQAQQKRLREKLAQIAGDKAVQAHDEETKRRLAHPATVSRDADVPQPPPAPAEHVGGMTNEQLVHELLLDKDFRLDERAGMSNDKLVHTKIRETFERAFWESLVEDLASSPPTYARVLSVLTEIRTGIEGLSQGQPEERRIGEVIDVDAITTQLRQQAFDYLGVEALVDEVVKVLLSMHDRMRSPERNKETADKWAEVRASMQGAASQDQTARARAACAALELVLDRVHAIRVDTANDKLRAIAPVIREHGVEYEKSHFVKKLDRGAITLEGTKRWIAHTLAELVDNKDERVKVQDLALGRPEDFEAVLYAAYVNLVADYPHWGGVHRGQGDEEAVPETMALDLLRIKALNAHFHTDVLSSVLLVTTEEFFRKHITTPNVRDEAFRGVQDALVASLPKPNKSAPAITLVMEITDKALRPTQRSNLQKALEKNVKRSSAVYGATTKIFKRVWYHFVRDGKFDPKCKMPKCAEVLLSEVAKHTKALRTVATHNKKVHVTRYNPIIKAAGEELACAAKTLAPGK